MTSIGLLGFGNMSGALHRAFLASLSCATTTPSPFAKSVRTILIYDPIFNTDREKRETVQAELEAIAGSAAKKLKIKFVSSAVELAQNVEIGVIGVKPQFAKEALLPLRGHWGKKSKSSKSADQPTIIVSMMAGVCISSIEKLVVEPKLLNDLKNGRNIQTPTHLIVARLMPNVGSLVRKGATGFSLDQGNLIRASSDDNPSAVLFATDAIESLFGCAGFIAKVPEKYIDCITALMGGPAWTAIYIEALADGGVHAGLPRPLAKRFAAEIVCGSASLLVGDKPAFASTLQLKEAVTSPSGTTIRGVAELEQRNFRSAIISAVIAADKRAAQLKKIVSDELEEDGTSRMSKL